MSKSNTAIKVLRENFIKKHQVHPDYFTHAERPIDEEAFCDRDMFYPKEFMRKNHHQGQGKLLTFRRRDDEVKNIPAIKLQLRPPIEKKMTLVTKSVTPSLTAREDGRHFNTYNSIPSQPSFIKTEKLRKKTVSARESRRPLPRYSAYMYIQD
jgi:hypothetical protein